MTRTPRPFALGSEVEFDGGTRRGVVWSAGPLTGSVWVAEDGDVARMVAVRKPSARRPEATSEPAYEPYVRPRLAEVVRHAVTEIREATHEGYRPGGERYSTTFATRYLHTSDDCPAISGEISTSRLELGRLAHEIVNAKDLTRYLGRSWEHGGRWCECVGRSAGLA